MHASRMRRSKEYQGKVLQLRLPCPQPALNQLQRPCRYLVMPRPIVPTGPNIFIGLSAAGHRGTTLAFRSISARVTNSAVAMIGLISIHRSMPSQEPTIESMRWKAALSPVEHLEPQSINEMRWIFGYILSRSAPFRSSPSPFNTAPLQNGAPNKAPLTRAPCPQAALTQHQRPPVPPSSACSGTDGRTLHCWNAASKDP